MLLIIAGPPRGQSRGRGRGAAPTSSYGGGYGRSSRRPPVDAALNETADSSDLPLDSQPMMDFVSSSFETAMPEDSASPAARPAKWAAAVSGSSPQKSHQHQSPLPSAAAATLVEKQPAPVKTHIDAASRPAERLVSKIIPAGSTTSWASLLKTEPVKPPAPVPALLAKAAAPSTPASLHKPIIASPRYVEPIQEGQKPLIRNPSPVRPAAPAASIAPPPAMAAPVKPVSVIPHLDSSSIGITGGPPGLMAGVSKAPPGLTKPVVKKPERAPLKQEAAVIMPKVSSEVSNVGVQFGSLRINAPSEERDDGHHHGATPSTAPESLPFPNNLAQPFGMMGLAGLQSQDISGMAGYGMYGREGMVCLDSLLYQHQMKPDF